MNVKVKPSACLILPSTAGFPHEDEDIHSWTPSFALNQDFFALVGICQSAKVVFLAWFCAWESAGAREHRGRNIQSLGINILRLQAVKLTLDIEMKGNALSGAISSCCGLCVYVCKVGGCTALPVYTRELISALILFFSGTSNALWLCDLAGETAVQSLRVVWFICSLETLSADTEFSSIHTWVAQSTDVQCTARGEMSEIPHTAAIDKALSCQRFQLNVLW